MCSWWTQAAVLAVGTLVVYRYAFFDVARADQLVYLYRTADIHGLWNLTVASYDFNRTHSAGDFELFRPVLYMLLGFERWLWGYNFVAWQATSIGLHITVVLSLFSYFRYVCRRATRPGEASFAPFAFALFFAFLYAGTEMVAWHHIVGYLLFCLLAVQALFAYQRFLDRRDALNAGLIVLLSGLACFTFELGNVLAGLLGLALLATVALERWTKYPAPERAGNNTNSLVAAVLLLVLPVAYLSWSYLNYIAIFEEMPYRPPLSSPHLIWLLSAKSVVTWTISIFVPGWYALQPGSRITLAQVGYLGQVPGTIVGIMLVCAIILPLRRMTALNLARNGLPTLVMALLGLAFTLVISIGRGVARGEDYVLRANTYYAYILALFLLIGLFHAIVAPTGAEESPALIWLRRGTLASLAAIAMISGTKVYRLHEAMYQTYSGPIGQLVQKLEILETQHRGTAGFSFSLAPDCSGIYLIPWFAEQALDKQQRYTVATALFPHEERDAGGKYIVHCP